MPAVQPSLLRQQAALLADHFEDPPAYLRSLHYLMDFYAERSRKSARAGLPSPVLAAYNVRINVLRMIVQELVPLTVENPSAGLALCDALWGEKVLEFQLLAALLIGQFSTVYSEQILSRLKSWLTDDPDNYLIDFLMENSFINLRREKPDSLINVIVDWLKSPQVYYNQLGLRLMLTIIKTPEFQNTPIFYRLLQPLTLSVPTGLRPDLLDVLAALAQRSPQETAYFLQKTLTLPNSTDTAWLIRQSIEEFPEDLQNLLRSAEKDVAFR